ncbi:MAG: protein phosphatase CheZ, partial [Pseudomonadota bacterium]
ELALRSVKSLFGNLDDMVSAESTMLAAYLANVRKGFFQTAPYRLDKKDLPNANEELLEVVKNTERAAETIMSAAEEIMGADPQTHEDYPGFVQTQVLEIFEACSFQDITGQRIQKVSEVLGELSDVVRQLIETIGADPDAEIAEDVSDRDAWRTENLIHGPQKESEAIDQNEVDEVFSQDDIDALFD